MICKSPQFARETHLVDTFTRALGEVVLRQIRSLQREFDYTSGKTDVVGVCVNEKVHAFEAKLRDWKVALHQARRNTCYAHYSYVVLPEEKAKKLLTKRLDFEKFGVGLISVSATKCRVAIRATKHKPLMPWLTHKARTNHSNVSPSIGVSGGG